MFTKNKALVKKIKKHGILGSASIIVTKIIFIYMRWFPWFLRPKFYFHLARLLFTPNSYKKRILGIWDFKALPWSIGDPLVFIETLSILKLEKNAEVVDICIVYDRDNPIGNRGRIFSGANLYNISPENCQDYMLEILPLFSTSPYLGSIHQFSSRNDFIRFLKMNIGFYNIFPFLGEHLGEQYNFIGCPPILNPMVEFYNKHGFIPYLKIGERDRAWARWFYLNQLPKNSIPVSLSLKRTSHRIEGNADPKSWLTFIDRCKLEFPEVVFFVVGLREEVFAGLRDRANVVIAKDFGTSVIEDLALIRASLMYMGTSSGVNAIAMFSDLPYLIFQMEESNYTRHGLSPDEKFSFVLNSQKIFSVNIAVTPDFLYREFKALYSTLDKNKWNSEVLKKAHNKFGHPTTKVAD